jgi:hypothetical protein
MKWTRPSTCPYIDFKKGAAASFLFGKVFRAKAIWQ